MASRTRAPRSSLSIRSDADLGAYVVANSRSSIDSVSLPSGALALIRLRQMLTPIRYNHVASDDWPAEIPQAAIGAKEDFLRQVARVLVVADEPIAQLIHQPALPLDDEVEGAGAVGETRLDERPARRARKAPRQQEPSPAPGRNRIQQWPGSVERPTSAMMTSVGFEEVRPPSLTKVTRGSITLTFAFLLRIIRSRGSNASSHKATA